MSFWLVKFDQLCSENKTALRSAWSTIQTNIQFFAYQHFYKLLSSGIPVSLTTKMFLWAPHLRSRYQLPPQQLTRLGADLWPDRISGGTGSGLRWFSETAGLSISPQWASVVSVITGGTAKTREGQDRENRGRVSEWRLLNSHQGAKEAPRHSRVQKEEKWLMARKTLIWF